MVVTASIKTLSSVVSHVTVTTEFLWTTVVVTSTSTTTVQYGTQDGSLAECGIVQRFNNEDLDDCLREVIAFIDANR